MCIELSKKDLDDLDLYASILGHIGDGNFHASIMYDKRNAEKLAKVEKCVYDMVDRALEMEGSCTVSTPPFFYHIEHFQTNNPPPFQGEHGVGMGKKQSLLKELGPETIDVMRSVKRSLDPHWLLNPGKIFNATRNE